MAHHKFNHNKVSKVLLSDYRVNDFADDDYFSTFESTKPRLFKKHAIARLPRLRPRSW